MNRSGPQLAILLILLLLSACGAPGAPSPSADASGLLGSWVLVEGSGPDGEVPIVDGARITLDIQGADAGGTSACNQYFARIAVAGGLIRFSELGGTEMACEPDVMASEAAYWAALGAVTRWARAGDRLILSGPDAMLIFGQLEPVPDAAMVDTVWVLDTLFAGDAASSTNGRATLELGSDGSLIGSTGCRTFTGRYVVRGDEVVVTELAMEGECAPDLAAQDDHVVSVLEGSFTVRVDGSRLTLGGSGNQGLGYTVDGE